MQKTIYGLFSLIFMFGCASTQVIENRFVSKNPDVSVLVDPAFKYIGSIKNRGTSASFGNMGPVSYEEEAFFFIKQKGSGNSGKSIVALSIQKVGTYFIPDLYPKMANYLEYDTLTLGNNKFYYWTEIEYPNMKNYKTIWLKGNGIVLPKCIITKSYSRTLNLSTRVVINYLEDPIWGNYQCTDWSNKEMLQNDQREFLKAFSKQGNESFKVIADSATDTYISSPQKSTKKNLNETAEKMKVLGELLEKGLITQEEYNDKKRKLLEQF